MESGPGRLTHLGRYQIVRVLSRGAMGMVYEGLDPRLNRPVAIKTILQGHLMDETLAADYMERFRREAQAVGRLAHPNIVTLHDFGQEGDTAYIVMEFVRGRELAAHFEAGDYFDLPSAVRILCELLDALAYAHGHGIVHRDVKPANVMIDEGGHVKLTDFGVARVVDGNSDRTQPGTMVGTPSYMSPEQILGLAVGSRADLFAVGVILYQFLAHERPFKGNGAWDVQRRIVGDTATPPSKVNPASPKAFDAIVAKALAKQPERRHADAAAFAAELRTALAKVPTPTARIDPPVDLPLERPGPQPSATSLENTGNEPVNSNTGHRWWVAGRWAAVSIGAAATLWLALRTPTTDGLPTSAASAPPATPASRGKPAASTLPATATATAPTSTPSAPAPPPARAASATSAATVPPKVGDADHPPHSRVSNPDIPMDPSPAVRQNAPSSAPRVVAEPASTARRKAAPRCADLLQQAQLGETLSPESLDILRKECR